MGALVTGVQTCALPIAVVAQSRSDSSALRKRRTRAFPVALSGHRPDIVAIMARTFSGAITAVLGPTNTGKTHLAIERMRSEEHTSELQSLMRISYAVFCLKKKKQKTRREN